jgi:hypothetical protein
MYFLVFAVSSVARCLLTRALRLLFTESRGQIPEQPRLFSLRLLSLRSIHRTLLECCGCYLVRTRWCSSFRLTRNSSSIYSECREPAPDRDERRSCCTVAISIPLQISLVRNVSFGWLTATTVTATSDELNQTKLMNTITNN